jgi:hypothetical protein
MIGHQDLSEERVLIKFHLGPLLSRLKVAKETLLTLLHQRSLRVQVVTQTKGIFKPQIMGIKHTLSAETNHKDFHPK